MAISSKSIKIAEEIINVFGDKKAWGDGNFIKVAEIIEKHFGKKTNNETSLDSCSRCKNCGNIYYNCVCGHED